MNLKIFASLLLSLTLNSWQFTYQEKVSLDDIIASKKINIECDWAMPTVTSALSRIGGILPAGSNVSRINLSGNGNFLKIDGDSISADLSYFGERQMGGGYSNDTGIKFKGVPKNLSIDKNKKKGHYDIKFRISEKTESYNISIRVFPNQNANIFVNSNQRSSIRYEGKIKRIEEN